MSIPEPDPETAGRALVIATHNQGKVRELETLLGGTGWEIQSLGPEVPEVEETGTTFAANARTKALYYAEHTGMAALADDSGLQIDALGGEPGVLSARYIHPDLSQARRNLEILARLHELPAADRGARFVCHLVLALPGRIVHETTGICGGQIALQPRGDGGFGYDPIFLRPEIGRTFAELAREEKTRLSHRGQAVRAMIEFLRQWEPRDGVC